MRITGTSPNDRERSKMPAGLRRAFLLGRMGCLGWVTGRSAVPRQDIGATQDPEKPPRRRRRTGASDFPAATSARQYGYRRCMERNRRRLAALTPSRRDWKSTVMSAHNPPTMTSTRLRREMRRARRAGHPHRNGTASLLAMLYLMIFSALALGFYAQTNVSAQVSASERNAAKAMVAADSGMNFMRRKLGELATPYGLETNLLRDVAEQLDGLMGATTNLTRYALEVGMSDDGTAVLVPRDENSAIPLGNGSGFRCTITRTGRR